MPKIEHIGIAVKNLDEAVERFSKLLNTSPKKVGFAKFPGIRASKQTRLAGTALILENCHQFAWVVFPDAFSHCFLYPISAQAI